MKNSKSNTKILVTTKIFFESILNDRQLDEMILALKRIGVWDYRISMGQTRIYASQKERLFDQLPGKNHLSAHILQDERSE